MTPRPRPRCPGRRCDASGWRASHEESAMIMTMLAERGPLTVGELVEAAGAGRRQLFALAIVWMCKLGLLDWSAT